jgi:hypothetical protein
LHPPIPRAPTASNPRLHHSKDCRKRTPPPFTVTSRAANKPHGVPLNLGPSAERKVTRGHMYRKRTCASAGAFDSTVRTTTAHGVITPGHQQDGQLDTVGYKPLQQWLAAHGMQLELMAEAARPRPGRKIYRVQGVCLTPGSLLTHLCAVYMASRMLGARRPS